MKTRTLTRAAGLVALAIAFWLLPMQRALADDKALLENFWQQYYGQTSVASSSQSSSYSFNWERLASAQIDECFYGLPNGQPNPASRQSFFLSYPNDFTPEKVQECLDALGQPKVNQAYVWGLAKSGPHVWMGTVANTLCLVLSGFLDQTDPMLTKSWVCEGGFLNDVRPPRIFMYDTETADLKDMTYKVLEKGPPHSTLLMGTAGLRSAGAKGNLVILGGIGRGGVTLFAFHAHTGEFLGSTQLSQYNNIRQWRVINGYLYTGFGKQGGGDVVRWTGSVTNPFSFQIVGNLQADPAYLVAHQNRIFVSTWGDFGHGGGADLYMSPLLGSDGKLTTADVAKWKVVWKLSDYEVEPAATQVGGALASYNGFLYWGTMHVPGTGLLAFSTIHGEPVDAAGAVAAFLGTYRPIVIFRGKDFGTANRTVQLVYGTANLPKYNADTGAWQIVPNNMHNAPKFGLAGINNFFNNYTWTMQTHKGKLFVGTMDWLYLGGRILESVGVDIDESIQTIARPFEGADLYAFVANDRPAKPVSLNGLGNYLNYGIRTVVSSDFLYLGTANPMNLETKPGELNGGWELYKLDVPCN